jgi:hypothetical protein
VDGVPAAAVPIEGDVVPTVGRPAASRPAEVDINDALIGLTLATAQRTMAGLRIGGAALRPFVRLALRPRLLPARLQPIARLQCLARAGAVYRLRAEPWLHGAVPAVTDAVLNRLDLTSIVLERVKLDQIIESIDVTALVRQVIDELDLPEIIRESSGTMASEAVVGIRVHGMRADEGVSRIVDRVLQRRGVRSSQLHTLSGVSGADQR